MLTEELKGAQRVPSLLILNPTQSLQSLHLQDYEVLDSEPLHDFKGHAHNLLQEIPLLLPQPLKQTITQIVETTVTKVSGVLLRLAAVKVYLKLLKETNVDIRVKQLMGTLVMISKLLYATESNRTPKAVLQLYNVAWLHHELCCELIPSPKEDKLYGVYFHDLCVHAPLQYQMVCLRSTNAESSEQLFSQIKHISERATNRKPENVLTSILLSMQAKEETGFGSTLTSLKKQDSLVTEVAKKVPLYNGTFVSKDFIQSRMSSWQAHLQRISPYLQYGEGIWWIAVNDGYQFLDADKDPSNQLNGPKLQHFRNTKIGDIWEMSRRTWESIVETEKNLPTPYIRLFEQGSYIGRRSFLLNNSSCSENQEDEANDQSGMLSCVTQSPTPNINQHATTPQCTPVTQSTTSATTPGTQSRAELAAATPRTRTCLTHLPVNLLARISDPSLTEKVQTDPENDGSLEFSSQLVAEEETVSVEYEMEHEPCDLEQSSYKSKAAILISKVIGQSEPLVEFDHLRMELKKKVIEKRIPTPSEKAQYIKLLVRLEIKVQSIKSQLKAILKEYETSYYCKHGVLPPSRGEDVEYNQQRHKLDKARKILTLWHKFEL